MGTGALGTAVISTTFIGVLRDMERARAARLSALLAAIAEPERLADVGELIIDCASGDDLIARVERAV